jgi:hypothetical protein
VPIRTPRGRSAAYRTIWQWPLRSPARLAAVVLALLVVVAGVSYGFTAFGGDGSGSAARSTAPSTAVRTTPGSGSPYAGGAPTGVSPSGLPPVTELTPSTLPPGTAPTAALQVAIQWANAWVNHPPGTTTQQWVNRLRPYTTDEYLVVLGGVDPTNVPANRVTGPARAVRHAPKSVQVEVPTDALTLVVLVVEGDVGWKVAGHDRATQ